MKKISVFAIALMALLITDTMVSFACTSVIASGKVTPDGRPLMWKNRDAGKRGNVMTYVAADKTRGTYAYSAIIDEESKSIKSIWAGTNEVGFSIMNTMSYNVNRDTTEHGGKYNNGGFMRYAIERCATVDDFEKLLQKTIKELETRKGGTGLATNFGVMDAKGNVAYFEAGHHEYHKYDVNDPKVAPDGYLVRSNFSYNGLPVKAGKGQLRYEQADLKMKKAIAENDVTPEFFLKHLCRSYANPLMKIDFLGDTPKFEGWAYDTDFITRKTTLSSTVIKGIKKGENPDLITMWTIISYPGTTVAMPVWVKGGMEGIPAMIRANDRVHAPLADWGYELKMKAYSWDIDENPDNAKKYFNFGLLCNAYGTGYLQKVFNLEDEILPPYRASLEKWYKAGKVDVNEIMSLNKVADARVEEFYKANFDL